MIDTISQVSEATIDNYELSNAATDRFSKALCLSSVRLEDVDFQHYKSGRPHSIAVRYSDIINYSRKDCQNQNRCVMVIEIYHYLPLLN